MALSFNTKVESFLTNQQLEESLHSPRLSPWVSDDPVFSSSGIDTPANNGNDVVDNWVWKVLLKDSAHVVCIVLANSNPTQTIFKFIGSLDSARDWTSFVDLRLDSSGVVLWNASVVSNHVEGVVACGCEIQIAWPSYLMDQQSEVLQVPQLLKSVHCWFLAW